MAVSGPGSAELNALVRVPEYQCRFRWATRRAHPALAMGGTLILMRLCMLINTSLY